MELIFKTREAGVDFERTVREIDPSDHRTILRTFARILDLHRAMQKPEPPLSAVEFFRQPERTSWVVDNVGLIFAVRDLPHRASVHIVFWDRRLRGRETLCRGLADYVIHRWGLDYLYTTIPRTSKATLAFCQRIGFEVAAIDGDDQVHLAYTTEVVTPCNT